jgi:hypothetical protein
VVRAHINALVEKEGIAAILFIVVCLGLALIFPADVGTSNQAPAVSHAVAPWIFGPFQLLLLHLPTWLGALLFPILLVAGLAGLPWIVKYRGERWGLRLFGLLYSSVIFLVIYSWVKETWWT